ncbi:MAG: BrxA family protein [Methanosarcinales archaeon]
MKLKTLTHSTYIEESIEILKLASKMDNIKELREYAIKNIFKQNSEYGRKTKCYTVISRYLQVDKNKIKKTPLIMAFEIFNDLKILKEILFYHYINQENVVKYSVINEIYPQLINNNKLLNKEKLNNFIKANLECSDNTLKNTCSSVPKALADFGFLNIATKNYELKYYMPTIESFAYALYHTYLIEMNFLNPPYEHIINSDIPKIYFMKLESIEHKLELLRNKGLISLEKIANKKQYALNYNNMDDALNALR